ncbi:MAG: tetratricopeptide repeat protein [Salibacteraceae bacterium]
MVVLFFAGLFLFNGCSTKKTGWAHRYYHSVLTRFNGYFNAKELMKEAEAAIDLSMPDNYTKTLPVYKELPQENAELVAADMDIVLEKCARVITKNSIRKRGKEHTKWVDDSYFLMGKAYYYKNDYTKAYKVLNQVAKKYKDQESRFDARFWLARLAAKEENYDKSMKLLSHLENDKELPERLKLDISKLYTANYLAMDNSEQAMVELRTAISHAKKKPERLRLTYLLGQLYKDQDEGYEAMKVFAQVLKMHPEYKMEFYTRIQMAMAYNVGNGDAESVRSELLKLLKDEKYVEFQDEIYYALAEMSYKDNDLPQTFEYLELSTEVSVENTNQKAKSFWRLGQLYFQKPNYPKAQLNYDSCVFYMPDDFPNGKEITKLASNLNDLVAQILIIEREDSLQMVANLDPSDREDLIADLIKKRKKEEEQKRIEEKNKEEMAEASANNAPGPGGPGGPGGFGGPGSGSNKWYFYNPTVKESGKADFARKWGKRVNQDDWRRSIKEEIFDEEGEDNDEPEFIVNEEGDTVKLSGDWLDASYYLKDLPVTDEAIIESNKKIVEAYYQLSIIYKEQMEDVPMAIETLEEMNNRFNPNAHLADSYYRLYTMNLDEENIPRSEYYKNKILNEFPNSQYARLIRDPNFMDKENEDLIAATKLYEKILVKYYGRGYYRQTIESCNQLLESYPESEITPKAEFLKALAVGHNDGEESLRTELSAIINSYPGTEYATRAQEILAGLDIKHEEARAKALAEANEAAMKEAASEMAYKYEPNSKHNFVIIVKASGRKLSEIKTTISNFNSKNYKMEGLKMSAIVYSKGKQMITVKSFSNAKQAKAYKVAFENNSSLQTMTENNPDYFIVSFTNYALFYKPKDHENYKIWSEVKYKDL